MLRRKGERARAAAPSIGSAPAELKVQCVKSEGRLNMNSWLTDYGCE